MSKCALYLYCPSGKNYDLDLMFDEFAKHNNGVVDVANMEMYADGWIDIPNGLSELINDLEKYDMVTLLTLDGLTTSDLRTLVDGAHLSCVLVEGIATSHNTDEFKRLCYTLEAREYYHSLRGIKIKAGMKKTDKHIGNVPFGHERTEDGKIKPVPRLMELAQKVKDQYVAGAPVYSIANQSGLTTRQVYGLMEYWGVKRG